MGSKIRIGTRKGLKRLKKNKGKRERKRGIGQDEARQS
jgi:hypothetical protein